MQPHTMSSMQHVVRFIRPIKSNFLGQRNPLVDAVAKGEEQHTHKSQRHVANMNLISRLAR